MSNRVVTFLLISVCTIYSVAISEDDATEGPLCRMYLAPSLTAGYGRGVFAGSQISSGEIMDNSVTVALDHNSISNWQLNNYVWATDESAISMAEFGAGMLFNHRQPGLFLHKWPQHMSKAADQKLAHTTFSSVLNVAQRDISAGEEIFVSYSEGNEWLEQRGLSSIDAPEVTGDPEVRSVSELQRIGHCLTHVMVKKSTLPFAGKGLFAAKDFEEGEIVTISPTMVIPKDEAEEVGHSTYSIIQNYCISLPNISSLVLFPFGLSALANHARGERANIEPEWYWWDEEEKKSKTALSLEELKAAPFAQLDIAYRATRNISQGEELMFDYGDAWATAWAQHLGELNQWSMKKAWIEHAETNHQHPYSRLGGSDRPHFLSFIGAPAQLLLPHWIDRPTELSEPSSEEMNISALLFETQGQDVANTTATATATPSTMEIAYEMEVDNTGSVINAILRNS